MLFDICFLCNKLHLLVDSKIEVVQSSRWKRWYGWPYIPCASIEFPHGNVIFWKSCPNYHCSHRCSLGTIIHRIGQKHFDSVVFHWKMTFWQKWNGWRNYIDLTFFFFSSGQHYCCSEMSLNGLKPLFLFSCSFSFQVVFCFLLLFLVVRSRA